MSFTKYEWQPLLKRKAANVLTDNTGFRQKKKKNKEKAVQIFKEDIIF